MAGISSLIPSIPAGIFPYVGGVALVLGLLLAFMGESVFKLLTSIIGAVLGAVIGYAFGVSLAGVIGGLFLAFIGAIIGGFLFYFVAEAGIALLLAYFTFTGILYLFGTSGGLGALGGRLGVPEIVGLIAAFAVFMVSIIFFSDIVAVLTAIAGGLLVDYGLVNFGLGVLGTVLAIVVIVLGMAYQFTRIRSKKMLKEKAKILPPGGGSEYE